MIGEQDAKGAMGLQVVADHFDQFFEREVFAVFGDLFPGGGGLQIVFKERGIGNNEFVAQGEPEGAGIAGEYLQARFPVVLARVFL
jgi:hypothetical protein